MERNVVSLETAKKLKVVGFPRVSMWHYSERMDPPDELFFTQSSGSTQFDIAAPTAQELADQLPGLWSVMNSKVTSNYHAAYHGSGDGRLNGLFAVDRGALPGQWVHAARRAALVSRIRAW